MKSSKTFQTFKTLVKKYWYIAVPTHIGTSGLWFGSFFVATKAGLDVLPVLEKYAIPEKYLEPLKKSNVSNYAQAFVLYKLVTPFRYASTLAVTSSIIKRLKKHGMIR